MSNSLLSLPPSSAKTRKHISIIKLSIPALSNSFSPLISPLSTTSISDSRAEAGSGWINNEDQIKLADESETEEIWDERNFSSAVELEGVEEGEERRVAPFEIENVLSI